MTSSARSLQQGNRVPTTDAAKSMAALHKYAVHPETEDIKNEGHFDPMAIPQFSQLAKLSHRLEFYLATSKFGMGLDIYGTFVSAVSCVVYVVISQTELQQTDDLINYFEVLFGVLFSVDFLIRFAGAKQKILHLTHWLTIIEMLTIIPVFFVGIEQNTSRSELSVNTILNFLRVLRIIRTVRLHRLFAFSDSEIKQQIYSMALTVLCLIYMAAGFLHLVENIRLLWPTRLEYRELDFFEIIYLIVTTITTVGYGDVVPVTTLGRTIIMLMMITALVVVPRQTNSLIALMSLTSVYGRQSYRYNKHTSHVIVCGAVNAGGVLEFFTELFHPDHGRMNLHAVVMGRGLPNSDMQLLLSDPRYAFAVTYLDGNVMSERDLKRAATQHAKGVFMLTNKFSRNVDEDDASSILRVLSIKRFVEQENSGQEMFTSVQLLNPESQKLFISSMERKTNIRDSSGEVAKANKSTNNHIVCVQEIKMNMLAKSCICPGMSTMICNLISSSGDENVDESGGPWVQEYTTGCGYEIYRVPLSQQFSGLSFSHAAELIYEAAETIMFALEINHPAADSRVILNPGPMLIPNCKKFGIHGFVIAEDREQAYVLANIRTIGSSRRGGLMQEHPAAAPDKKNDAEKQLAYRLSVVKGRNRASMKNLSGDNSSMLIKNAPKSKSKLWKNTKNLLKKQIQGVNIELGELYFLADNPVPLEDAMLTSVDDYFPPSWGGHILVIGNPSNLYHFILPLRSRHLSCAVPIVVLFPTIPSPGAWQKLSVFTDVYFVQGSPLEVGDLNRARAASASRAVIFAKEKDDASDTESALIDADIIFAYSILSKLNENIEIIGEIVTPSNISFLHDEQDKRHVQDYHMSPPFAAGRVYTSSVLDTLVCQAYYNRHIITILHQLVAGGDEAATLKWNKTMEEHLPNVDDVKDSHLFSILVPEDFHMRTFGELLKHLVAINIVPLGLRRAVGNGNGEMMNSDPYVYTAPSSDSIVYRKDSVFILSDRAPENDSAAEMMAYATFRAGHLGSHEAEKSKTPRRNSATDLDDIDSEVDEEEDVGTDDILEKLSLEVGMQMSGLGDELKALMARVASIEKKLAERGPVTSNVTSSSGTSASSLKKENANESQHKNMSLKSGASGSTDAIYLTVPKRSNTMIGGDSRSSKSARQLANVDSSRTDVTRSAKTPTTERIRSSPFSAAAQKNIVSDVSSEH